MNNVATEIPAQTWEWLLDPQNPGERYLALHRLTSKSTTELSSAREIAHTTGPIAKILKEMHPDGYWVKEGPGYLPKYRSSVWSIILLSQLGAKADYDPRIATACCRYLDEVMNPGGQISSSGPPSGTVDCLQGNILAAMLDLGYSDSRLELGFEWMARSLTGEGVAPMGEKQAVLRYYSGKIGPGFQCGANNKLACAWGASKVMLAFSLVPESKRTPLINRAIQQGVEFLFSCDPVTAEYPSGWNQNPSGNWWKFGFPVFYVTDLLQICEALTRLGLGKDPRLQKSISLIQDKKNSEGKWLLEYDYKGKTWLDFGEKKIPNKWVSIRAYQVLQQI
jgi:hypothetical protein